MRGLFICSGQAIDPSAFLPRDGPGWRGRTCYFTFNFTGVFRAVELADFHISRFSLRAAPMRLFTISGLSTRSTCRLSTRRVAMRANSNGPPRLAALVITCAAVRMTGVPRSDDGTVLTRNDFVGLRLGSAHG
jgi:hypothetical protein